MSDRDGIGAGEYREGARIEVGETNRFLAIAQIARPQGRRGEVSAEILTDFPARFQELGAAYIEDAGGAPRLVTVERAWPHKGRIILKFSGVDSIDAAERLRGLHVFIRGEDRVALPEHHYYVWELEGCRVVRESEGLTQDLGVVTEVERNGGVDLLRVASIGNRSRELLIPLAQDICKRIDIAAKAIFVDPPEDLLELNK